MVDVLDVCLDSCLVDSKEHGWVAMTVAMMVVLRVDGMA